MTQISMRGAALAAALAKLQVIATGPIGVTAIPLTEVVARAR